MPAKKKIGELLIEAGVVSEAAVQAALAAQASSSPRKRLGELLVDAGAATPFAVAEALAKQYELPFIHLPQIPASITAMVPLDYQVQNRIIPFRLEIDGKTERLHLALDEPSKLDEVDELRFQLGKPVRVFLASSEDIQSTIAALRGETEILELLSGDEEVDLDDDLDVQEKAAPPAIAPIVRVTPSPVPSSEIPIEWDLPAASAPIPLTTKRVNPTKPPPPIGVESPTVVVSPSLWEAAPQASGPPRLAFTPAAIPAVTAASPQPVGSVRSAPAATSLAGSRQGLPTSGVLSVEASAQFFGASRSPSSPLSVQALPPAPPLRPLSSSPPGTQRTASSPSLMAAPATALPSPPLSTSAWTGSPSFDGMPFVATGPEVVPLHPSELRGSSNVIASPLEPAAPEEASLELSFEDVAAPDPLPVESKPAVTNGHAPPPVAAVTVKKRLDFSEDDLRILDNLERLAQGQMPLEPSEQVTPGRMVATLIRILVQKGLIGETELLEELARK